LTHVRGNLSSTLDEELKLFHKKREPRLSFFMEKLFLLKINGTGQIAGRRYAQLKCINRNPPVPNIQRKDDLCIVHLMAIFVFSSKKVQKNHN